MNNFYCVYVGMSELEQKQCKSYGELMRFPDLDRSQSPKYQSWTTDAHRLAYSAKSPFPHAIFHDVFPVDFVKNVASEFPSTLISDDSFLSPLWSMFYFDQTKWKRHCIDHGCMGESSKHLLAHLKSPEFVTFLEALTGIHHLIPDAKVGFHHHTHIMYMSLLLYYSFLVAGFIKYWTADF